MARGLTREATAGIRSGEGRGPALRSLLHDRSHPLVSVLDSQDTNVFVADTGLQLIWMNQRAEHTLHQLEPAIRATFKISVAEILDGPIHRFHTDPARVEQVLHAPGALPHQADFSFGEVTLTTRVNAITTPDGSRLGYVVVWDDITERARDYRDFETAMIALSRVADSISEGMDSSSDRASAVAAATEELRASVAELAYSSTATTGMVQQAITATATGTERLADLQRSSTEIGNFLRLITNVAEQTKLLALNATIEAARAGEAGRGFAVVADEVKQLATTTSASISDIEARITAIRHAADAGAEALTQIAAVINQLHESQTSVAAATEEQSAVAAEIAQSVVQIADDVRATAENTEQIRAAAHDVTSRTTRLTHR